jgi:hypothetical protein
MNYNKDCNSFQNTTQHKMTKKYFCEKMVDLGPCGEANPEKFAPGRYSKCKKCRNLELKQYQQQLKEMSLRENMEERTEELKDGKKIQLLVESIIRGKSFNEDCLTIPEDSHYIKDKINTVSKKSFELFSNVDEKITKVISENSLLKEKIERMEKIESENSLLKDELQKIKIDFSRFKMLIEEKLNLKFN